MTHNSEPTRGRQHRAARADVSRRAMLRRTALTAGGAAALAAGVPSVARAASPAAAAPASAASTRAAAAARAAEPPLKDRAAARGLIYSAMCNLPEAESDEPLAAALVAEAGATTAGGNFLMKRIRGGAPDFPFVWTTADRFAAMAERRKQKMLNMGHLVWHAYLPDGYADTLTSGNARDKMTGHIRAVASRYSDRMHSWNVVNEVVDPAGAGQGGLRASPWLEHIGPEYIDHAFHAARAADPDALLVINDYGFEGSAPEKVAKRKAMLDLVRGLVRRQVPVGAVGLQAHLAASEASNPGEAAKAQYRDFLNAIEDLGLKIMITELDVWNNRVNDDPLIAKAFGTYLAVALENRSVVSVQTWGLSDKYGWDGRFLPLSASMQRKQAWSAIGEAFDNAPAR